MADPGSLASIHPTDRLVGQAPVMGALRAQIRHLAGFDTVGSALVPTVLLQGETGTGKGLVARVIHDSGPRAQGPFLDVNCAAIPETLLEAELFGFEAGAFTDARRAKPGLFQAAAGGTLFLDEIDALPLSLQHKLLKAIEEKRIRRLGAVREHRVDVKLIAATQTDLNARILEGYFRADLYHRLAVILLHIPPLRERGEDILVLAQEFLRHYAEAHRLIPKQLSPEAGAWLQSYAWPGNVRELSHLVERVTLLHPEVVLDASSIERLCLGQPLYAAPVRQGAAQGDSEPQDEPMRIRQALVQSGGNVVRAARLLGLSRDAVRYRMRQYGIQRTLSDLSSPLVGEEPSRGAKSRQSIAPHTAVLRGAGQGEEESTPLVEGMDQSPNEEAVELAPAWEQKPVAVLAIELTWPAVVEGEVPRYEPWTMVTRWEQLIVEKVQGLGGMLLQRTPSLLLVGFGLPHTLEQLPQRVVQATLALRQLTARPEGSVTGELYPAMRQAVHWGQVLVDSRAKDPATRLLPVGETLALPVRLLGHAAVGEILVSPEVGRLVEAWCELQTCEGLRGAEAYTVVGLRPQRTLLRMHGSHPLSRFVGRAHELATLQALSVQVEQGHGQVVALVGEPGVGKSRLCYEFMRVHHSQGWQILETSADSYGQVTAYLPVIDLLKAYFHIAERDDGPTMRTKVSGKLLTLGETLGLTLPAFLMLLDVPVEAPAWQSLEPPQRRQRLLEAIKWLLLEVSRVQPLLLVVENLHWIDTETQAVLESLIESLPAARLFLLVTYRPEYQHAWGSKTYYTQLRLDPLAPAHTHELLAALLGEDASLGPLARRLVEHTEGNPLFLEESVRMLVETQDLVGERGAYHLAKPLFSLQVPVTVQAILAARMDRLSVEAKRLLQAAAGIGREVPLSLLQAIAEQPEEEVRHGLRYLQAAEFLYETRLFPEIEYTFKHALTQQVAYENLPQERRRLLHAQIVDAMETLYAERRSEQVERLAHHALRGEVWDKALCYYRQAGAKAEARSAYREAVACFEQALRALQHLPESRSTLEQAIDLRFDLRNALLALGDHKPIVAYLRQAETLAQALGDQRRLGWVLAYMTRHLGEIEGYDRTIVSGERALAIAESIGDVNLQVVTQGLLGQAYHFLGDYRRGLDVLTRNMASLAGELRYERFGLPYPASVHSRTWLVASLAELGAFAEGSARSEEECRIAEAVKQPYSVAHASFSTGFLHLRQGDLYQAITVLERGLELCQIWNVRVHWYIMAACLGYAYALSGRVAEAVLLLEQALGQVDSAQYRRGWNALCGVYLSEAYLLAGRREEALQLAERTLADASEQGMRGKQAWTLRLLGIIHAQSDPLAFELAETSYRQALACAEELGMRPLQAHLYRGLGLLYTKIGRRQQAREELSTAITLYRTMEMTFWLPQAEAALAQVT